VKKFVFPKKKKRFQGWEIYRLNNFLKSHFKNAVSKGEVKVKVKEGKLLPSPIHNGLGGRRGVAPLILNFSHIWR
jgi:hypothetical protein